MNAAQTAPVEQIDPRSARFGAAITTVVLALTLITWPIAPGVSIVLLVAQTLAFACGALLGLRYQPYGRIYRKVVRPRIGPPAELEDAAPPRFAQSVGLSFALVGLGALIFQLAVLFYVAVAFAFIAAALNALFNYCLGCEVYLLVRRLSNKSVVEANRGH
jgi:hypothetical protein